MSESSEQDLASVLSSFQERLNRLEEKNDKLREKNQELRRKLNEGGGDGRSSGPTRGNTGHGWSAADQRANGGQPSRGGGQNGGGEVWPYGESDDGNRQQNGGQAGAQGRHSGGNGAWRPPNGQRNQQMQGTGTGPQPVPRMPARGEQSSDQQQQYRQQQSQPPRQPNQQRPPQQRPPQNRSEPSPPVNQQGQGPPNVPPEDSADSPEVSRRHGRALQPEEFDSVEPAGDNAGGAPAVDIGYVNKVGQEKLDALPYGLIVLDSEGKVLFYNETESKLAGYERERVVGKNFFEEVAPCTQVQEFQGRFEQFVEGELGRTTFFDFAFHFESGTQDVTIALSHGRRSGHFNVMLMRQ